MFQVALLRLSWVRQANLRGKGGINVLLREWLILSINTGPVFTSDARSTQLPGPRGFWCL